MTISFEDVPAAPESTFLARTRPPLPSRRVLLRTVAGAATAVAFGALETVNAAVAKAAYFQEYTNTHAGPCAPGGYADREAEKGLKCGPSLICPTCCWTYPSTRFNRTGWHRAGSVGSTLYTQRPNQCWAGTYEAWRWKFKDGHTYRCSDGYRFTSRGATKTICPWSVTVAAPASAGVRSPWMRTLTSPVVPLGLLALLAAGLLAAGRELPALCAVAAVAGVALSGST